MVQIKFSRSGQSPNGQPLYTLSIDGRIVEAGLTIKEVVERINEHDELRFGEAHVQPGCSRR